MMEGVEAVACGGDSNLLRQVRCGMHIVYVSSGSEWKTFIDVKEASMDVVEATTTNSLNKFPRSSAF